MCVRLRKRILRSSANFGYLAEPCPDASKGVLAGYLQGTTCLKLLNPGRTVDAESHRSGDSSARESWFCQLSTLRWWVTEGTRGFRDLTTKPSPRMKQDEALACRISGRQKAVTQAGMPSTVQHETLILQCFSTPIDTTLQGGLHGDQEGVDLPLTGVLEGVSRRFAIERVPAKAYASGGHKRRGCWYGEDCGAPACCPVRPHRISQINSAPISFGLPPAGGVADRLCRFCGSSS